jgi:uncharacterized membrane protein
MEHIFPTVDRRKSQQSRMLLGLSGGALLLYGMRRRSLLGGLFSLAGGPQARRAGEQADETSEPFEPSGAPSERTRAASAS